MDEVIVRSDTKLNNQHGTLCLTEHRVHWVPQGSREPTLYIPFKDIKNQQVTTAASPRALLMVITDDTPGAPSIVFEFTHPTKARHDQNMFKEAIAQALPKKVPEGPAKPAAKQAPVAKPAAPTPAQVQAQNAAFGKITKEEVMRRGGILAANRDLQALHTQLVRAGVVSEDEFWENHKALLESDAQKAEKQSVGMSSRMVDVRPSSESCNAVHYKLTPQVIHGIFIQFPVVEKAYKDNVPTKMTENDFWVKYFQSQYFHRDRLKGVTSADELFDKYKAEVEKDKDPILLKRKLTSIIPLNDLSADSDAALPDGYGVAVDDSLKPSKLSKSLPLIRRMNRHAEIVVGAMDIANAAQPKSAAELHSDHEKNLAKVRASVEFTELAGDANDISIPLKIKDHRRYFDSNSSSGSNSHSDQKPKYTSEQLSETFNSDLTHWKPDLKKAIVPPQLAHLILEELQALTLIKNTTTGGDIMKDLDLSPEFQTQLFHYFDLSNELLRHFWSSMPHTFPSPPLSKVQTEKLIRVTDTISKVYDEIYSKIRSLNEDNKSKWGSLLRPITESLSKAVEKYNNTVKNNNNNNV